MARGYDPDISSIFLSTRLVRFETDIEHLMRKVGVRRVPAGSDGYLQFFHDAR